MSYPALTLLSSMATRPLLAELVRDYERDRGVELRLESVGGVEAAQRVQAGEVFDVVVLANDALVALAVQGLVGKPRVLADSSVAVAVRAGASRPDIGSEAALRQSLLAARSIGYSTGPSGTALLRLFERWGLVETLKPRLLQARPGQPVGHLVAEGEAEIGFQQRSELQGLPGITLLGGLPPGTEIVTTFAGALGARTAQPQAAQALLDFLAGPAAAPLKRVHGMSAPA